MVRQLTQSQPSTTRNPKGVGGRRRGRAPVAKGGGYPNICNIFEIPPGQKKIGEPLLAELQAMGMQEYWLLVAQYLGMDKFLGMWRLLDSIEARIPKGKRSCSMTLILRPYSNYERFQKNRYAETLAATGLPPREIQAIVKRDLGENMSIVNIGRLARKNKIRA